MYQSSIHFQSSKATMDTRSRAGLASIRQPFTLFTSLTMGCLVLLMTACGAQGLDEGPGPSSGGDSRGMASPEEGDDGDSAGTSDGEDEGTSQSGQNGDLLTAGAWDDNLNYDFFEDFLSETDADMGFEIESEERLDSSERFGGPRDRNTDVDITLVLDTTGSMGDELAYLVEQIQDIAEEIQGQLGANASSRWALVAYKDVGDAYVTRVADFSTLADFQVDLGLLFASGGGDYPEASAEALRDATQLSWRSEDDVARMVFWVADAPHHLEKSAMLQEAIMDSKNADVHIYPVASSGVDLMTEMSMRSAAQITGGRYLFLTDDSGIGESHLEPTIPCYFVTTLSDAMVRMVSMELSGEHLEPSADEVIRAGGDPQNGRCVLEDGTEIQIL
jgi:uncharacterized protein YegL